MLSVSLTFNVAKLEVSFINGLNRLFAPARRQSTPPSPRVFLVYGDYTRASYSNELVANLPKYLFVIAASHLNQVKVLTCLVNRLIIHLSLLPQFSSAFLLALVLHVQVGDVS